MPFRRLSPRQHQIADLICLDGLTVVAIARRLDSSVPTVRAHVREIAHRLPNPHGLPAYKLIQSYASARRAALLANLEQIAQERIAHEVELD